MSSRDVAGNFVIAAHNSQWKVLPRRISEAAPLMKGRRWDEENTYRIGTLISFRPAILLKFNIVCECQVLVDDSGCGTNLSFCCAHCVKQGCSWKLRNCRASNHMKNSFPISNLLVDVMPSNCNNQFLKGIRIAEHMPPHTKSQTYLKPSPHTWCLTLINASTHNNKTQDNTILSWLFDCTCAKPMPICRPDIIRMCDWSP